jgi:eukaryotic-like serine/threonine-protein kinase
VSSAPQCLADETLFAFVLGQLAPESVAEVERHLSECDECRTVVAETAQSLSATEPARSNSDGPLRIGRYDLLGLLGAGAYGVVYRAFDPDLRRTVALKVLRPDEHSGDPLRRERMVREAQAMAQLSHPNVVAVYDVGVHSDTIYIVMEYVAGGTVRDYLKRESRGVAQVLGVYLQAGRGLAAAHAKGLVHRDFKPENVLVGTDGQVRVTDFGLARIAGGGSTALPRGEAQQPVELSTTKGVIGTPGYVAPEQFAGAAADARSDQFSFCVALFSGLYGRHPFRAETGLSLEELSVRVRAGAVEDIPEATRIRKVHRLLLRGLDPDPKQRLPHMDALLLALEGALEPAARWKWPALGAALLAALVSLAVFYEFRRTPTLIAPSAGDSSKGAVLGAATTPSVAPVAAVTALVPAALPASASSANPPEPKKIVRPRARPASSGVPKSREQRYVDGLKEPF